MSEQISGFLRSESGVTSVEYALLAMCIVLAIVAAVAFVGTQLNTTYTEVSGAFN